MRVGLVGGKSLDIGFFRNQSTSKLADYTYDLIPLTEEEFS